MDIIYVIYWSQTGNTQAMAETVRVVVYGKYIVMLGKRKRYSQNSRDAQRFT